MICQLHRSSSDFLAKFNYDGDWVGTNNWENLYNYPQAAHVFYSVVESATHYFIGYYWRRWRMISGINIRKIRRSTQAMTTSTAECVSAAIDRSCSFKRMARARGMGTACMHGTAPAQKQNVQLEIQIAKLKAKLNWLEQQFHLSQQKRFGASSERTNADQLELFNEAESESTPAVQEPTVETIQYIRRKKRGQREELLENLPVETVEYRLSEDEQVCTCCCIGKTTVARILVRLLREMGGLSKGHLVTVERAVLVGEYIGRAAVKRFWERRHRQNSQSDCTYFGVSASIEFVAPNEVEMCVLLNGKPCCLNWTSL